MFFKTIVRNTIGVIGFPLTIWNFVMDKKYKVQPPGEITKTKYSDVM
ncbi:hypothetical protein ACLM5H_16720 [Fredinandcohnia humi]